MSSRRRKAMLAAALLVAATGLAACDGGGKEPPGTATEPHKPLVNRVADHLDAKVDLTQHLRDIKSPDPLVRLMAVDAMAGTRSPRAVAPVAGLLKDHDPAVRKAAAMGLGTLGRAAGVAPLRKAWARDDDPVFKIWVAFALVKLTGDETCRAHLRKAMGEKMPEARMSAVAAVARLGDTSARQAIAALLKDPDWSVRFNAAKAVGDVGGSDAFGLLLPLLEDEDHRVAGAAAWSLGQLGDPRVLDHLVPLLDGPSATAAVDALGRMGDDRALPHIIKALHHEDERTRSTAVRVLAKFDAEEAVPALIKCLLRDDDQFRRMVTQTLQSLTGQPIPDEYAAWNRWYRNRERASGKEKDRKKE